MYFALRGCQGGVWTAPQRGGCWPGPSEHRGPTVAALMSPGPQTVPEYQQTVEYFELGF